MQRISREHSFFLWDAARAPAATISSGETVEIETWDNVGGAISAESDFGPETVDNVNPTTGPIAVRGAQPGDALAVTVEEIRLDDHGHLQLIPGAGLLADRVESPRTKILPIENGHAIFSPELAIPLRPMIGVIGTTPVEPIHTISAGDFGGNMDNPDVRAGVVVYLPVFVAGGLLGVGDLHAAMGDGELCCTGVETSGSVVLSIDLIRDARLRCPVIDTGDAWMTVAVGTTADDAIETAASELAERLAATLGISLGEAVMLISAAADARICQALPNRAPGLGATVRVVMPKLGALAAGASLV